jgi:hypothetical protein
MPDAEDHAQAETERKRTLFASLDRLLEEIGLAAKVAAAHDLRELASIIFDPNAPEIDLTINDALNPADGSKRAAHFGNLSKKVLKRLLQSRFNDLKKDREKELSEWQSQSRASTPQPPPWRGAEDPVPHLGNLVHSALRKYVEGSQEQLVAITLWIIHTHIFDQYEVTPRLILFSPAPGCGKSTALKFIEHVAARGMRLGNVTAAAMARLIDSERATLLLDEGDNLEAAAKPLMRAVLNDGHERGAPRLIVLNGRLEKQNLFAPLAIATLTTLPASFLSRAIRISMTRATAKLERLDTHDQGVMNILKVVRGEIEWWVPQATLALDPSLPKGLHNRQADNWRPLVAIADALGGEWGKAARRAAMVLTKDRSDEAPSITLLIDIRETFHRRACTRITSADLIEELVAIESSPWAEWRGLQDNQQARPLTRNELARLLHPFKIRPRTIWPASRVGSSSRGKSAKGYLKEQFQEAWRAYCPTVTPSQPSAIKDLLRSTRRHVESTSITQGDGTRANSKTPENRDHPKSMVGGLDHANDGVDHESVFAVHRQHLVQPDDMRARPNPLQGAHHDVPLDHGGLIPLRVLDAVRRVGEH